MMFYSLRILEEKVLKVIAPKGPTFFSSHFINSEFLII